MGTIYRNEVMKDSMFIIHKQMYGSRVICNPPPIDTDEDYIIYTTNFKGLNVDLIADGWKPDQTKQYYGSGFHSYRLGNINYVVTDNIKFYEATLKATELAKSLNLKNKNDRKNLFIVVYHSFGLKLNE